MPIIVTDPCPLSNADLAEILLVASYVVHSPECTHALLMEATEVINLIDEIVSARLFIARLEKDLTKEV